MGLLFGLIRDDAIVAMAGRTSRAEENWKSGMKIDPECALDRLQRTGRPYSALEFRASTGQELAQTACHVCVYQVLKLI